MMVQHDDMRGTNKTNFFSFFLFALQTSFSDFFCLAKFLCSWKARYFALLFSLILDAFIAGRYMGEGRGGFEITSRNQFMYGLSVSNDTWSYFQIWKQRDTE